VGGAVVLINDVYASRAPKNTIFAGGFPFLDDGAHNLTPSRRTEVASMRSRVVLSGADALFWRRLGSASASPPSCHETRAPSAKEKTRSPFFLYLLAHPSFLSYLHLINVSELFYFLDQQQPTPFCIHDLDDNYKLQWRP
jgi:hypothetical protein